MFPNFENGEYILTDKVSYKFVDPQRGDVVVFRSPENKDIDFIKRIIGLPGDRVKISNGSFYINGEKLDESYIPPKNFLYPGSFLHEGQEIIVPVGEYFVSGDNRPRSSDSREWGTVPMENLIGRSFFRYWPMKHAGLIKRQSYKF